MILKSDLTCSSAPKKALRSVPVFHWAPDLTAPPVVNVLFSGLYILEVWKSNILLKSAFNTVNSLVWEPKKASISNPALAGSITENKSSLLTALSSCLMLFSSYGTYHISWEWITTDVNGLSKDLTLATFGYTVAAEFTHWTGASNFGYGIVCW